MKYLSFIFNFMACFLMIASNWHNELQFSAIMAGIFAIYYKVNA